MNSIEKMLRDDIRTMKRIGSNVRHQKGKRGLGTGNFNPLRGMTQKQIAKLHGETRVYDMTKILPMVEFKKLDDAMQKLHLEAWRARFETGEIIEKMGIAQPTYYKYCKRLGVTGNGVPRKKYSRKAKEKNGSNIGEVIEFNTSSTLAQQNEVVEQEIKETNKSVAVGKNEETTVEPPKQVVSLLTLDETVSGEKLAARLRAIAEFVNDDEMYNIYLSVSRSK